uniref:Uncharacterized protein n=1 Tax=viral metagenome TaxID=1070528 RepID=A0A6C0BPP5_9ZZZZ
MSFPITSFIDSSPFSVTGSVTPASGVRFDSGENLPFWLNINLPLKACNGSWELIESKDRLVARGRVDPMGKSFQVQVKNDHLLVECNEEDFSLSWHFACRKRVRRTAPATPTLQRTLSNYSTPEARRIKQRFNTAAPRCARRRTRHVCEKCSHTVLCGSSDPNACLLLNDEMVDTFTGLSTAPFINMVLNFVNVKSLARLAVDYMEITPHPNFTSWYAIVRQYASPCVAFCRSCSPDDYCLGCKKSHGNCINKLRSCSD